MELKSKIPTPYALLEPPNVYNATMQGAALGLYFALEQLQPRPAHVPELLGHLRYMMEPFQDPYAREHHHQITRATISKVAQLAIAVGEILTAHYTPQHREQALVIRIGHFFSEWDRYVSEYTNEDADQRFKRARVDYEIPSLGNFCLVPTNTLANSTCRGHCDARPRCRATRSNGDKYYHGRAQAPSECECRRSAQPGSSNPSWHQEQQEQERQQVTNKSQLLRCPDSPSYSESMTSSSSEGLNQSAN